jgi:type I restriction enzyme S subunit
MTINLDRRRVPVRGSDRKPGPFPYYGASGIVDYVDDFIFEGLHLLVAEDGENLRSRKVPVAFLADGKFWVNNHAHVLQANDENDTRYISYALEASDLSGYITGSVQPKLNQAALNSVLLPAPPLAEQRAIAATLGALDDKIGSNGRVQTLSLDLALAHFDRLSGACGQMKLAEIAQVVLGGTPSKSRADYWQGGTVPWLNSGTANQQVILEPSAYITDTALRESAAKLMPSGATVIAITGATLGQVALLGIEASGNQSLVGIWSDDSSLNTWLHFAVRRSITELVKTATGAAQQHVNKGDVENLTIPVPSADTLRHWASLAEPLVARALVAGRENAGLTALRDVLSPELLSGRRRVVPEEGISCQ